MVELMAEKDKAITGLGEAIDKILDKGLVINADVMVSVSGTELLGVKIRAALASFEAAAKHGLEFPSGTNIKTSAWKEAMVDKEKCPQCGKRVKTEVLLNEGCPWCGWKNYKAKAKAARVATQT